MIYNLEKQITGKLKIKSQKSKKDDFFWIYWGDFVSGDFKALNRFLANLFIPFLF